ncbi:hypothetical protein GCM10009861_04820 [Neomicrococcus aestuarii]
MGELITITVVAFALYGIVIGMPRPRIHDVALRNQMLDEAARITAAEGVEGLSARRLCTAVNTSTTAVYTLFGGMDGVRFALYRRAADSYFEDFSQIPYNDDEPLKFMDEAMLKYRRWSMANPNLYGILFGGALKLDPTLPESSGGMPESDLRFAAELATVPTKALLRAIELGHLPIPINRVPNFLLSTWACMHGLVSLEINAITSGIQSGLPGINGAGFDEHLYVETIRSLTRGLVQTYHLDEYNEDPSTEVLDELIVSSKNSQPGENAK